ncbi:fumarylacetoacetate hydrolase family protein [Tardiphaga sp.]|jgi:2-keto-4-pentenoate hydratase/2-oxohepta-3-ene-1,7-dioic acid hydratase in catechol pathway|uniref:fumarylacetoacetate hydrolase family protein n=1 Tax=Tardiphaga sp. TaxID=1926292 RepID=UPI0037DA1FD2
MKFVSILSGGAARLGVMLDGERVLDLAKAEPNAAFADLISLIEAGAAGLEAARRLASAAPPSAIVKLSDVTLQAPIPSPRKNVFCVGRNYIEHVEEGYRARGTEVKLPEYPQFFTKPRTAVIGAGATVPLHANVTAMLDYEVELAVIIGRGGVNIPIESALDHIFGFTIINDVTGRDVQRRHDQWFKGKGLDGTCPMGPWVVERGDVSDPQALNLSLKVNGEVRQSSNTRHMIFPIARIISELSLGLTLEPGDIIATGTPSGVGYAMTPPRPLKAGDVMTLEIEQIGTLENRVGN